VEIKAKKDALDAALSLLQKKYDEQFGVMDLMTTLGTTAGLLSTVVQAMPLDPKKPLPGALAPFSRSPTLSVDRIKAFFETMAQALDDRPPSVWLKADVGELLDAAFTHYTECHATSQSVLTKLIGKAAAAEADRTLGDASATTGRLGGTIPFKKGLLTSRDVGAFSAPTKESILLMVTAVHGEHIFVLAQADKKWRLYQSFHRKFLISQPGFGNVAVDDLKKFLTDITGANSTDWFAADTAIKRFDYLLLG
jgi:hypothetical protein